MWIIKAVVTMQMALDRYDVTLKKSGQALRGKCPIHRGSNDKHFTANISKNVFKCFFAQCGAHGNVLDFVAAMEQCSVREAAIRLSDWFRIGESGKSSRETNKIENQSSVSSGIYEDKDGKLYEVIGTAIDTEDDNVRLVYRELFGDYHLRSGPLQMVTSTRGAAQPLLNLVKPY